MRFSSDYPNHIHQLLVSVSTHYVVKANGQIRFQKKKLDVSLRTVGNSSRVHVVYYVLRDVFSGFYYVEVTSSEDMIPIQDFLLRAFLPKPDIYFCGIPKFLMVPQQVENLFSSIDEFLAGLNIEIIHPVDGFDSGIAALMDWESKIRVALLPEEDIDMVVRWNPRTAMPYLRHFNSKKHELWQKSVGEVFMPSDEYVRKTGSPHFKYANEYTLHNTMFA